VTVMAAPPRPAEALATRESDCPLCPHPIHKGDPIKPTTLALGWAHTGCANDFFEVYPPEEKAA
jgi:hypothetical protein